MEPLRRTSAVFLLVVFLYLLVIPLTLQAQQIATPVECGTILEAEFTPSNTNHNYTIELRPGDTLYVRIESVSSALQMGYRLHDPADRQIDFGGIGTIITRSPTLPATGRYRINVYGYRDQIGSYSLYIGCTLRDGTEIAPGDVVVPQTNEPEVSISNPVLSAPAFGFAGLPPVDFANVVPFSIPAGVPMIGGVTPAGGEILGYLVNGNQGDVLELHFTRLSGNLNLGLVVLSQNNELAFQASLTTTNSLTTQLTLPSAGDYTVGVFRVDLLPPAAPQPTTFQIQAVVNP